MKAEILSANEAYQDEFGEKGELGAAPARRCAILTCMDARLDPAKFAGLAEGDAHVIRNAGGRASDDAIRSLVLSHKLLGTTEWFVIHHTNCGLELIDDQTIAALLEKSLTTARFGENGWENSENDGGSTAGHDMDWLTFHDAEQSVVDDVRRIRNHPLVSRRVTVHGFIYDVSTGSLNEVPEASRIGAAS